MTGALLSTERRRAVQPLWSALDHAVRPWMSGGVLLAVSGGSDSRALLEAFARWRFRFAGPVAVASVDHGVRAEAPAEVDAVAARARALGFDAVALHLPAAGTDEASLRRARYRALVSAAGQIGLASVCTAHHADDDAEGFLLDALGLGGGRRGASMERAVEAFGGRVLRPFLRLSRGALAAARSALGAHDVVTDPLDEAGYGSRALLRLRALPALRDLRPNLEERLARKARLVAEDERALSALSQGALEPAGDGFRIRRDRVSHAALARRAVEEAIQYMAETDPRRAGRTVDALLEAAGYGESPRRLGRSFDLPGAVARIVNEGIDIARVPRAED